MERIKTLNERGCPSCNGKDPDDFLRPYCSVVCRRLACYGLGWRTEPYRIVDLQTGVVVAAGPYFDLSSDGIGELVLEAKAARRRKARMQSSEFQEVSPMEQMKSSIEGSFSIPGVKNVE
jgi:endogenous inhibitor of DNA gyrase (YacG/DUF329 family)